MHRNQRNKEIMKNRELDNSSNIAKNKHTFALVLIIMIIA